MQLRMIYGSRRSEPIFLRTPRTKASSRSLAAPRAWLRAARCFFLSSPPHALSLLPPTSTPATPPEGARVTRGAPPPLLVYFVCAPIETYLGGAAVFFSFGFWLLVFL